MDSKIGRERQRVLRLSGMMVWILSLSTLALTGLVILVWLALPGLKEYSSQTMKFNTAVSLGFGSLALWLQRQPTSLHWQQRLAQITSLLVIVLAGATGFEYLFGFDLGIDQLVVTDYPTAESSLHPGRMSPIAVVALCLLGLALLLLDTPDRARRPHWASLFVGPVMFIGLTTIAGYVFGSSSLYTVGPYIRISWLSSVCLLALGGGVILARPTRGLGGVILSPNMGGQMARRLLPVTLIAPLLFAWMRIRLQRSGSLDIESGVALVSVALTVVHCVIIYFNAKSLTQIAEERSQGAQRLHESERTFRAIFQQATVGITRCEVPSGRFLDVNNRIVEVTGYSAAELRQLAFSDITHADDRATDVLAMQKLQSGEIQAHRVDKRYIRKDGQIGWVRIEAAVSKRDPATGAALESLACVVDITQEKTANDEMRRSEARFRSLFESAMFGMIYWNAAGEILAANEEFLRLSGYSRADLEAGRINWQAGTPPEYAALDQKALEEFARMGRCTPYEKEFIRPDGSRVALVVGGIMLNEVAGLGGVGFILDNSVRKSLEGAWRTSEDHLKTITESIPQIVWTADAGGKPDFFNQRWFEYTQCSLAHVVAGGWQSLVHGDDFADFQARWQQSIASGEPCNVEYRLRGGDGHYRWHLQRALALKDQEGQVLRWFGTITDVHDQKTAYAAILKAKNRVDSVVSNTDAVLFSFDRNGTITYSEGQGLKALGLTGGERVGRNIYELHKDQPQLLEIERRALQGEKVSTEYSANNQWFEIHYSPQFDAFGKPDGVMGLMLNVTEKHQAENALNETQKKLKAVLQHVPIAFWAADLEGRIIFCEGTAAKALMVGGFLSEVFGPSPEMKAVLTRAFSGEPGEVHTEVAERCYHVIVAPSFADDGKLVGLSGITFDITDKKIIEDEKKGLEIREKAALEASQLKSAFLANMSHEIRTPINGVIGMLGLLADTPLQATQREYIEGAKASADALLTVINDILDFSKVEAGKLAFEDIDFNLWHLLQEVVKTFTAQAQAKGLNLLLTIEPKTPKFVGGDPGRIRQILNNLLSNALKFTDAGEVTVIAQAEEGGASGGGGGGGSQRLRIIVKDTGIGIPADVIPRMFQPFSQADTSTTRRFGGTGLGLSICKYLVTEMHGSIGIESSSHVGSTFWFTLGLRAALAPLRPKVEAVGNLQALSGRRFRALVAEDNPINQKIALRVLEKMGLSADAVANGHEVLEAHRAVPYDIILMDCQMPELDGYAATRAIRANSTQPRGDIPIVAMTANAITGDKERCLAAGMNDYIAKPVNTDELFIVLCRWLLRAA